jgi:CubicO group peptidase (beta-lactamase class C family)
MPWTSRRFGTRGFPPDVRPAENQHRAIAEGLFLGYDAPLSYPAGDRMSYCNYNFDLLGEIVRRVSGRTLADFADERIFRPLGMVTHTSFCPSRCDGVSPAGSRSRDRTAQLTEYD